jgi:hypothetical protein
MTQVAAPTSLPGGAALAPGETPTVGARFMLSTVAFYLHAQIVLTNRRLYTVRPNTLLGLIPVGTSRSNFPIENIAGVSAATRFNVLSVFVGALAFIVGWVGLSSPGNAAVGLILLIGGVLLVLAAPKQAIEVMNSGGGTIRFPVSVFERGRTVEFSNRVSEAVARRPGVQKETSQGQPAARIDPSDAMQHLNRLREQGLITEAEYETKRTEILARL